MRNGGRAHAATNDYTQTWCTGGEIGHVVLSGGARVRYVRVGNGPPLFLMHTVRTYAASRRPLDARGRQRGHTPVLVGRDAAKLKAGADAHPGLAMRIASADSPTSLDRALSGAAAVINCAGPYSKL
jgi:hypothetical protein